METGIGATLEKRNPLFAQQVVPFSENALENLDTPLSIGHIFGFLHHGEVESNKIFLASSSKDNQESLNKRGEGQIIAQAYERKKLWVSPNAITIHLPPGVKRDVQSTRIFCEELGLDFPEDSFFAEIDLLYKQELILEYLQQFGKKKISKQDIVEALFKQVSPAESEKMQQLFDSVLSSIDPQLSFEQLEKLEKAHLINIYELVLTLQEKIEMKMKRYPHLKLDDALLTTKKGEKKEEKVVYPGNISWYTEEGTESAIHARMRIATYIYETQKQLKSRQKSDQLSADIFVGHRTGVKGFEDIKYGNKHLKYDFVAPEGKLDLMYTDSKGNILNQKSETYFEFDLENYEAQLAELKPFIKDLNGKKTLIENQNIVNDYFLHLNEELFGEEASKNGKRITLIQHYLSAEQSLIASKTLSFLTTSLLYSDPQQSELQKLLIDYFTQQDNTGENNDIYIPIFKQAYEARKKSDLRKLLLYFLKKQDNNISSHLERIADEPTIIAELKTIDQRLTYESMEVESIIGKEKFSDLYLPQQITKEGNEGVSYEVETLLKDILWGEKPLHLLSAYAGSGKSFFVDRCMQVMNDTAFLYENGVMNCETKEIDVNEISLEETSESFAKKFNLSEKNQNFLLFDALDEKETGNITVVRNILADEHFQEKYHIKALFTSRYFDEERKRTEGRSFYTLQKEQDLEKYITTYQNFLSNSRQKQTYITLVNQVAEQLGSDFSPLLIGMLVLLVDNKEIRGKVARNTLQRSDIYEAFISEYLLREEKKADSIHDGTEEFYNPIYEESKVKLLETLVEDEFHNTGNEVWTPDIRLSKKMEEHGQEFLGFFPAFLEKLSPEDQKLFNKEKFALFLQHLENLGFLQRITSDIPGVGGQYNFGLSRLHKSFYDYIGYETVKEKSLDEYFQGFMDIALSPAPNHRGIREYLISRFFDSKKELIPFIERLRAHQFEVRRAMGSDFFALISDFLWEIVGDKGISYDFFTACDIKKADSFILASEYFSRFNALYRLDRYIINPEQKESYRKELTAIHTKILQSSEGKQREGNLWEEILATTEKYGISIEGGTKYDELPAGFEYILNVSPAELLTNRYFGFA